MLSPKAIKRGYKYLTRKDRNHRRDKYFMANYGKKPYRKVANKKVRMYKGEYQNCEYKKIGKVDRLII